MPNPGMMSSKPGAFDELVVPPEVFGPLNDEFHFGLDVCTTSGGIDSQCRWSITEEQDCLSVGWPPVPRWMNPPYSRLYEFSERALEMGTWRAPVVMLCPVFTDQPWWREFVMHATEIRLIEGRVRFLDPKTLAPMPHSARFPSAAVVFSGSSACHLLMQPQDKGRKRS